ncbi:methylenetetrahydrofolate reductase C-terminal domain-containing protein [bacterium]|nr:methylenetetrahydrofolate reductase C-terminal domain-containing protein [candidate division CSSED10-310 bacterium]
MIVGKQKPIEEILEKTASFGSILVVGCGGCVTVCHAGGEKEVGILAEQLELRAMALHRPLTVIPGMAERQCDTEFIEQLRDDMDRVEAVLTIGCGAGAQTLASVFPQKPVIPGLNTRFIGAQVEHMNWAERCIGCGDCVIGDFGGLCPVARCSKHLLNGPCGGSNNGHCEMDPELDCIWDLIIRKLEASGQLDRLLEVTPARNWQTSRAGGVRRQKHEDSAL